MNSTNRSVYRLLKVTDRRKIAAVKLLREHTNFSLVSAKSIVDNLMSVEDKYRSQLIVLDDVDSASALGESFDLEEVEIPKGGFLYIPPGTNYDRYAHGCSNQAADHLAQRTVFPIIYPVNSDDVKYNPSNDTWEFKVDDPVYSFFVVADDDVVSLEQWFIK